MSKVKSPKYFLLEKFTKNSLGDLLDIHSDEVTKQLFLAILGREADEEGLKSYAEAISVHHSLIPAIQGLLESGEFSAKAGALAAPEIVDALYHGILGREADAEGGKNYIDLIQSGKPLVEIIQAFKDASGSHRDSLRDSSQTMMSLQHGKMINEYEGSVDQLRAISVVIKKTWEHLGRVKAHHSVITDDAFLPESLDGNIAHFWESGESEVDLLQVQLNRHGINLADLRSCVEYGCGVGRITIPLARYAKQVAAYDISQDHLRHAEARAGEVGLKNCHLHLASDPMEQLEKCDLFYSRIVFQHNPPPIIHQLIKNALASLNPGGVAVFQVPTYIIGYSFRIQEWLSRDHAMDMQMHCIPQEAVFKLTEASGCSILEVREDNSCGDASLYLSNTFVIRKGK
jgi:SAM-dependent methyltransferase